MSHYNCAMSAAANADANLSNLEVKAMELSCTTTLITCLENELINPPPGRTPSTITADINAAQEKYTSLQ